MLAAVRILGIDPGLNRTGYGLVDVAGNRLRFVDAGVIRVPPGELACRLGAILAGLREVIATHRPGLAVVEQVFVNSNPASTLLLGQARGAALCAAVDGGLAVHEVTALQVKQAVVGYGRADKRQVQLMVQRLLGLSRVPVSDAADALASAICHAHRSGGRAAAAAAAPATRAEARRASGAVGAAGPATAAATASPPAGRGARSRRARDAWRAYEPPSGASR